MWESVGKKTQKASRDVDSKSHLCSSDGRETTVQAEVTPTDASSFFFPARQQRNLVMEASNTDVGRARSGSTL